MSDPTLAVYERRAVEWRDERAPRISPTNAEGLAETARSRGDRPLADLGCGPGWYTAALGANAIALDGAAAMLALVPDYAPEATRVRADLAALPFRRGSLGGVLASKSYVHLPQRALPLAFADLHRSLEVGAPAQIVLFGGDQEHGPFPDDEFAGRLFSLWPEQRLRDVLVGAGFEITGFTAVPGRHGESSFEIRVTRVRTLADSVGPAMRLLVCGLNPSIFSADAGVEFARPGNRFWPAARAAGLVDRDRDAADALRSHGVGFTDLVKRATRASSELSSDEYREGLERVRRLVQWMQPRAVCFVGLEGWRAAVDKAATAGIQDGDLGGAPVYVMPSTSGLNAHSQLGDLTEHLRLAARLAARGAG